MPDRPLDQRVAAARHELRVALDPPPPDLTQLAGRARSRTRRSALTFLGIALFLVGLSVVVWDSQRTNTITAGPGEDDAPAARNVALASVDWDAVTYPIDCDDFGWEPLHVEYPEPAAGVEVAVVMVACDAGAGSPPRSIFVYDRASPDSGPHLLQTLSQDGRLRLTDAVGADGVELTATGGTYSSTDVARCCPDGEFTARWAWTGDRYEQILNEGAPDEPVGLAASRPAAGLLYRVRLEDVSSGPDPVIEPLDPGVRLDRYVERGGALLGAGASERPVLSAAWVIGPVGDMVWLSELIGRDADGNSEWRLLDLVTTPRFSDPFYVALDHCGTDGDVEDDGEDVVAVARLEGTGGTLESTEVLAAWRPDRATGKLEALDPATVTCIAHGD